MDLRDFIQEVLDNEFPGERKKREIHETRNGFNFACPFCGDSFTVDSKKRGNVYLNSKSFKCFNDGCMTWMPLKRFVGMLAVKHEIDIAELDIDFDGDGDESSHAQGRIDDNDMIKFLTDTGALGTMLDLEYVKNRFSLINVRSLSRETTVQQFLEKRMLYDVPGLDEFIFADPNDKLIYIFNYHKATGKILSLAYRRVDYKKYKVIPYTHLCDALKLEKVRDNAEFIDQLGEHFNVLNVDFKKPMRITEGQIDSLFLKNGMAMQGVSKSRFLLDNLPPENVLTMFDRDKGGMGASLSEIQVGRKAFMWSLLVSRLKRKFGPEEQMLKSTKYGGMKDTNDLYVFMRQKTGLSLDQFNMLVDKYFTSSKFDIVYL